MIVIELPWLDKRLSPNGRGSRHAKADATKKARALAHNTCLADGIRKLPWCAVKAHWRFYPPGLYRFDDDNLEGRCKAYRDGVSDCIGIDDYHWTATREICEVVKGGKVVLEISERKDL